MQFEVGMIALSGFVMALVSLAIVVTLHGLYQARFYLALMTAGLIVTLLSVGRELFGLDVIHVLLALFALVYLVSAVWLVVRGIRAG